jgi:taurine transport system substrate-binding protein
MKSMKKIISFILGSIVAVNLGMSVANAAADEVRIAFFLEWATPNQEAKIKNVFDKAFGVPVRWTNFATGVEMTEAMLSGDIDISYSQGMAPFVNAVNAKAPIKMVEIAVTYGMGGTTCVVDKSISKANADDLEGMKVAVPLGTMADYVYQEMMKVLGVDASKIQVVDMEPADGAIALIDGNVSMACLFGKNSISKALEGGQLIMTVKEAYDAGITGIDITSVTDKFAKENPEMVRTFIEVNQEYNTKFAAGKSDMASIAKDAGMTLDKTKNQMSGFGFPTVSEQKSQYFNKGGKIIKLLDYMGKMFASAENPALKDYSKVVDTSFLDSM